ncbi:MAG: nicotinamide riboside transporter PnuC [Hyphomicrobiales bacterium]|nr:nicotinamide riboside transporter PnuC [Hyphomicrobiales bacterium]
MMIFFEILAVIFALSYLYLAMEQNIACWYAAFFSTSIYIFLYWDVSLYMESLLNFYYLGMAVYGWRQWRNGSKEKYKSITIWSVNKHILIISLIILLSFSSGYFLSHSDAVRPYLDSFTTWASVITTYMVTQKILSNWLYWIVINSVGIFLNLDRELYLTVLLLLSYQVISILGYFEWRKSYYEQL